MLYYIYKPQVREVTHPGIACEGEALFSVYVCESCLSSVLLKTKNMFIFFLL